MTSVLVASNISVRYGGVSAVNAVDLSVDTGRLVGLIGPNGAGKTTFIDAISGFVRTSTGTVTLDGVRLDGLTPHRRAAHGLGRTFQGTELFDDLTVRENVLVAAERPGLMSLISGLALPSRKAGIDPDDTLKFFGLRAVSSALPSALSLGQRKLVSIAIALSFRPKLVMLDEPSSGLDGAETRHLGAQLRRICVEGVSMLLVDHDMSLVLSVCDYVYVLHFGQVIAHGRPGVVRNEMKVIEAYLGSGSGREGSHRETNDPGGASPE